MVFYLTKENTYFDCNKKHTSKHPRTKSFLRSPEEWDLTQIFYEDLHEISFFGRSSLNFSEKFFEEFFIKIFIKTFSSKNLQKIYINFLWKIFKQFISFKQYLWKIFSKNLFEIYWKSFSIFLKNFSFNKILSNYQKWSEDLKIFL